MKTQGFDFQGGELLLLDKPYGWTSFKVVDRVRRITKVKKVGHAGTLDPLATGLLILCTGKKTKELQHYTGLEKEYTGTFRLGQTTPSYDLETQPQPGGPFEHLTPEMLANAARPFIGAIAQKPPLFSAVSKDGEKLYEKARRGEKVELEARPVEIREFELTRVALPEVDFRVVCSKGTYLRSLAHDFGQALGCGAYLQALRRTRIGAYGVKAALEPQDLKAVVQAWRQSLEEG